MLDWWFPFFHYFFDMVSSCILIVFSVWLLYYIFFHLHFFVIFKTIAYILYNCNYVFFLIFFLCVSYNIFLSNIYYSIINFIHQLFYMFSIFQYYIYHILENFDEQKFEGTPSAFNFSVFLYILRCFVHYYFNCYHNI